MATSSKAPRVSVVIPTYNRAKDMPRCLDSLLAQTCRDFEVLVCDDGSTDGTAAVVERYRGRMELEYLWGENFGGPARPRNRGLQRARGEYVAFLDSDDWWAPRKLEESLRYLDGGADLVYHDLYLAAGVGRGWWQRRTHGRSLGRPVYADLLANGNIINNSSVVTRRALMLAIDGFSEERSLIAAEDYDAWLRVARKTDAFAWIPATLGYYWVGGGNLSNPKRLLLNLAALEQRYAADLAGLRASRGYLWSAYAQGRAHYQVGSYAQAAAALLNLDSRRAPLSIRIKRLLMLAGIRLRGVSAAIE